jgi:hypothetical protein
MAHLIMSMDESIFSYLTELQGAVFEDTIDIKQGKWSLFKLNCSDATLKEMQSVFYSNSSFRV